MALKYVKCLSEISKFDFRLLITSSYYYRKNGYPKPYTEVNTIESNFSFYHK